MQTRGDADKDADADRIRIKNNMFLPQPPPPPPPPPLWWGDIILRGIASEIGAPLKGKNLLPLGANSFL